MMTDLVAMNEAHQAAIQEAADAKVAELKAQIEEQAHADIAQLEECVANSVAQLEAITSGIVEEVGTAIEDAYDGVGALSDMVDELAAEEEAELVEEEATESIALLAAAASAPEPEVSSSTYVFAGIGLAGVASAAYFMTKKQEKTVNVNELKNTLVDDEEFV